MTTEALVGCWGGGGHRGKAGTVGEQRWRTLSVGGEGSSEGSSEGSVTARRPGLRPRPPRGFAEQNGPVSTPTPSGKGRQGPADGWKCGQRLSSAITGVFAGPTWGTQRPLRYWYSAPSVRRMRPLHLAAMCCLLPRFPSRPPASETKTAQPQEHPPGTLLSPSRPPRPPGRMRSPGRRV